MASLASSADSGVESAAEAEPVELAGELGDDDEVAACEGKRAAMGQYVVWSNGYFTLSDNPNFPDVKVRALPRWSRVEGGDTGPLR